MNTDCYFYIGDSHKICQDYAFNSKLNSAQGTELHIAVVADGCSSSRHTDFGARILSLAFVRTILSYYDLLFRNEDDETDRKKTIIPVLERILIKEAASIASNQGLALTCLDATLLAVFSDGNMVYIMAWGDGFIQLQSPENETINEHIAISNESGAPYYLSYLLDEDRQKQYKKQYAWPNNLTIEQTGVSNFLLTEHQAEINQHISYYRELKLTDLPTAIISVFSDGLDTVIDQQQNHVASDLILNELTAFKNTHGEFVHRRMGRFLKRLKQKNWSYYDDIAMASLYTEIR